VTAAPIEAIALDPAAGRVAALQTGGRLTEFDTATGAVDIEMDLDAGLNDPASFVSPAITYSPTGRFIVVPHQSTNLDDPLVLYTEFVNRETTYRSWLHGQVLAFGSNDSAIYAIKLECAQCPAGLLGVFDPSQSEYRELRRVSNALESTKIVAALGESGVEVWNLDKPSEGSFVLPGSPGTSGFDLDQGGRALVGNSGGDALIRWNPADQQSREVIATTTRTSTLVTAMSPDGQLRAVSDDAKTIQLRNVHTGAVAPGPVLHAGEGIAPCPLPEGPTCGQLLFSPTGDHLIVNTTAGGALLFDVRSGVEIDRLDNPVRAISGDGTILMTQDTDAGSVELYDVRDVKTVLASFSVASLEEVPGRWFRPRFALSYHGRQLAGTNAAGTVVVWRASDQWLGPKRFTEHNFRANFFDVAFSPKSGLIAVKAAGIVRIFTRDGGVWHQKARRRLDARASNTLLTLEFDSVAISNDGILATDSGVYDSDSLEPLGPQLYDGAVADNGVFFSTDGYLITERWDMTEVVRWDVRAERLRAMACRLAGRRLSPAEWDRLVGLPYAPTCSARA
jgi:WD40 repeat protein